MEAKNKFVQTWMPLNDELVPFYQGISTFLLNNLDNKKYVEVEPAPKVVADPLLGYINLTPLEVAIIDTNLYQRLRKIRQLGLAYLVFPTLNYSRFEHSLGVVGRLNQILNKLIENYNRTNSDADLGLVIKKHLDSIRLAALLHDIGHCLFSHCSERVINKLQGFRTYPSSSLISEIFSNHFINKERTIPFAELFSVSIIGSKQFEDFISQLNVFKPKEIEKVLENCCRFILGLPVKGEPQTVFFSQLMSSGLDVDKIDYMMREQHYTGIKLEIDLDRILSKINVFDLESFQLPNNLKFLKTHFDDKKPFKVLGFSKGGQFVFEEFCIARLALHVKIYLHQKVRAAESQLSNCLEDISKNKTASSEFVLQKAHSWLSLPESIIENPTYLNSLFFEEGLFTSPFIDPSQIDSLKKIDSRNLFCRAFAFGQINSYSESTNSNETISQRIENFFEVFHEEDLEQKIRKEALEIERLLGVNTPHTKFDEFLIDIPRLRFKSIQQGQESLYFERSPLSPLKWTIPLDKIIIYFEENRALGYVFSSREIAPILGLASEKVVFELSGKVFSQEGNISKSTYDKMTYFKRELTIKGFYQKLPELREISDYLKLALPAERIKNIHENLLGFESLKKERITVNRVTTFVNQFPIELQDACLSFLEQIEILDERLLESVVSRVVDRCPEGSEIGISHLGGVSDSGGRLSYYLRDLFEKNDIEAKEVNDGLILKSDILVLYDDNINSGLQLLNIIGELLDELHKLPNNMNLQERHVTPLTTMEAKQKLKNMPLHFCFIVGFEGIETKIKESLIGLFNFKSDLINIHINKILKVTEKVFSGSNSKYNHKDKLELKNFISTIGEQLLANEGKLKEKIETCKLGYASAEATVLFPYNIPTMTVTALWCKGQLNDGIPWIPLAERRRRTKDGKFIGED